MAAPHFPILAAPTGSVLCG